MGCVEQGSEDRSGGAASKLGTLAPLWSPCPLLHAASRLHSQARCSAPGLASSWLAAGQPLASRRPAASPLGLVQRPHQKRRAQLRACCSAAASVSASFWPRAAA